MYSFDSRIRYSECDSECELRIDALMNYFQDASTFQSEDLGAGFAYLMPRNLVWVVASWQIEINRYPRLGEEVRICTAPYGFKGFLGYRNFWIETNAGEKLAIANSIWTLLDFAAMKPKTAPQELIEKYPVEEPLEMDYSARKIAVSETGEILQKTVVQRQHLDSNQHVNNVQYVNIASDYLPADVAIEKVRVEYKKQAHLHDVLVPYVVTEQDRVVVSLRDEAGAVFVNVEFLTREKK